MPGSEGSLRLTDAYQARLLALRDRTVAAVAESWQMLDWEDLDGSFRRWLPAANQAVMLAQTEAVRLSGAYVDSFVANETGEPGTLAAVDPDDYAGLTRDGRRVAAALAGALVATKLAVLHRRGRGALGSGLAQAVRVTRLEVVDAGRRAAADIIAADERIVGWRRVTRGRACGACLGAASGNVYGGDKPMPVHSHCACVAEPVVRDVPERARRRTGRQVFDAMSKAEQDRLFAGRGGVAKADLVRSGAVSLSDLVTVERGQRTGEWITETPLAALAR